MCRLMPFPTGRQTTARVIACRGYKRPNKRSIRHDKGMKYDEGLGQKCICAAPCETHMHMSGPVFLLVPYQKIPRVAGDLICTLEIPEDKLTRREEDFFNAVMLISALHMSRAEMHVFVYMARGAP